MDWKTRVTSALGPSTDDSVLEELAQHAAATYASARAEGCDAAEAEQRVTEQIHGWAANPGLLRRRPKRDLAVEPPAGSASPFSAIAQDTRYAWRLLRRQPAYAALVIATMALGIAATTVIGSVAYGVLLKPLPWADAPRLVRLYESRQGSTRRLAPLMTNATYWEWRTAPKTLDAIAAWSGSQVTLAGSGVAQRIQIAEVTPSLLPMLHAAPFLGRTFAEGDEEPGRARVIVLSHGLWQQSFGGRPDVLGQTLRLNSTDYSVIGVMPAGFAFPDKAARAWTPFHVSPVVSPGTPGFSISMFQAIGRLRPGVTPAQAAAEGTVRGRAAPPHTPVAMAVFGSDGAVEVTAVAMLDAVTRDVRPAILILLTAVVLLLATATLNVASLQLARVSARRRELAIRSALGAARGRLIRQALIENLLVGVLGGITGLALAAAMHRATPALLPADFPRLDDLAFDFRIQAFAIAVSLAAGFGCGLLPALAVARRDLVPALVEDSLAPIGSGMRSHTARARAMIMAGQIAIACVLLVGALLLSRSFVRMLHADLGYQAGNLLTARVILPGPGYTPDRKLQVLEEIVTRMEAIQGVSRAAFTTSIPFSGNLSLSSFPLRKRDGTIQVVQSGSRQISPGYFTALGQKVLEGREFTSQDAATDMVVIVNREFSRRYLEGRALGWTLPSSSSRRIAGRPSTDRPIIGVVEDTMRQSVTDTPEPEMYFVANQLPIVSDNLSLVVRTAGDPRPLVASLRSIVQTVAPSAPLESVMTMEDRLAATLARPRLYAVLLGTFAAFALAIAGVGLFGVLSYTVAQRAREIGVRTALGAQVRDIVGLVIGQSMAIAGAGVAVGLVASFWLTSALQKFLYGVTPHDVLSFSVVAGVLFAVSVLASVVPARRAAKVNPVQVLRG
jgi:putative ABC transport system permease protein